LIAWVPVLMDLDTFAGIRRFQVLKRQDFRQADIDSPKRRTKRLFRCVMLE